MVVLQKKEPCASCDGAELGRKVCVGLYIKKKKDFLGGARTEVQMMDGVDGRADLRIYGRVNICWKGGVCGYMRALNVTFSSRH